MRITENKCNCSFKVMPITDYPECSTLYNPTWEESGVLTLIYKVETSGVEKLIDSNLSIHVRNNKPQREVFNLDNLSDGWYKVRSYILPTKKSLLDLGMFEGYNDVEYQAYWKQHDESNMFNSNHDMTIAVDEESATGICFLGRAINKSPYDKNLVYHWLECTDMNDLLDEINQRGVYDNYVYGTNVRVIEENFFTTCNTYKCFIKKATDLLDQYKGCSNTSSICNNYKNGIKCKSDIDENSILIRDYLWMALNAIKYAVECEDYISANKILNCINTCNGICNDVETKESDCGCS